MFETTCSFASHTVISSAVFYFFLMFLKFLFTNLNVSLCMQYRDDRLGSSSSTHTQRKRVQHKKKLNELKKTKPIPSKVLMKLLEKLVWGEATA